jgi:N-acetylglucosaminyldiphosphoundecaprenol N-acetyl-beta-D-mannosaminyltransferase
MVSLMGLDFASIRERDAVDYVLGEVGRGRGGWICTANLDILRQWVRSAAVREVVDRVDLVLADGMPVVWASSLRGTPLPERVAGSTLTLTLSAAAAGADASVFLLGGNPGTAEAAARRLRELNPSLRVAGTLCPPLGFEDDPEWIAHIARCLRAATPDIVYVGLGFPKQERLIDSVRSLLPDAWFVGCGVSFSFLAGEFKRAPTSLQRLGLEWLHRMVQEPRRLSRRYLLQGMPFMISLFAWSILARLSLTGAEGSAAASSEP